MKSLSEQFLPKIELRHFLAIVLPGLIVSITLLVLLNSYPGIKLLPSDITSIGASYLTLLLLYLFVSSLFFGIILMFAVLLLCGCVCPLKRKEPLLENYRDEIKDKILESYGINISYKNNYRLFFGSVTIALLFLLVIIRDLNNLFFILGVLIIFSFYAYVKIKEDVINTPDELIISLIGIKTAKKRKGIVKKDINTFFKNRLESDKRPEPK